MSGSMGGPYRPASWRGVAFGVWEMEGSFGRATHLHEYPFRDPVWVEDMGRGTRKIGLIGFGVGADPAAIERQMIDAAEEEGAGQLVHPTLGTLTVSLVDFATHHRFDLLRVVEFRFVFIEGGERGLPSIGAALGIGILDRAAALDLGAGADFLRSADTALREGVAVVTQAQRTVRGWTAIAGRLAGDVRTVLGVAGGVVPGLDRTLGRFDRGFRDPLRQVDGALRTVSGGLSRLSAARGAVNRLAARMGSLAGSL